MAAHVGFIPAVVGGHRMDLAETGSLCEPTPENVRRFREWWKYIRFDQLWVWVVGCFLGMGLPALLTVQFIPPGTTIGGMAVAVRQAEGIASAVGGITTGAGTLLWYLTLLTGFWILFSTQLGITDAFVRLVTDLTWTSSGRLRDASGGDVRKVYYGVMVVFCLWGCVAINLAQPLILILLGANMAGFNFIVLGLHTTYVNRKFLPAELRPALWRQITTLLAVLFFLFFVSVTISDQLTKNPSVLGLPSALPVLLWFGGGLIGAAVVGALNRVAEGEDTPAWMLATVLCWPVALWLFFTRRAAAAPAAGEAAV